MPAKAKTPSAAIPAQISIKITRFGTAGFESARSDMAFLPSSDPMRSRKHLLLRSKLPSLGYRRRPVRLGSIVRALVRLARLSDLPVITNRPWMERQKRVAIDIGRNGSRCRGMRLHHFLMVLEHCSDHVVDEVVWQIRVCHREVV